MKAVQFSQYGGPEVLELIDVPEPHPAPGQVRIRVRAAGVNGIDSKIRAGDMREVMPLDLPAGTGRDAAGVVDEVGAGVSDVEVGEAVFGSGSGTFAEYAVLTSWATKPDALSFAEAAGFGMPVETALRILDQVGIQAGQTLLISGASGGVGSATTQIAVERGIRVIATASPKNQDYLTSLGAVATTYGPGLVERVRDLAPDGVDAALDIAGSGVIPELVELTGDPTTVLSIADFSAPDHGARVSSKPTDVPAALTEAARLWEHGHLSIPVERTFTLDHAAEAQAANADGHVTGRLVMTVP